MKRIFYDIRTVFVVSLGIRLLYMAIFSVYNAPLFLDGKQYDEIARRILELHEFSIIPGQASSFRPPLFPFFLAFIYGIFGYRFWIVRVIQAILSSITVFPLFGTLKRIWQGEIAIWAAWIWALYPSSIYLSGRFYTETLFVLLLVTAFYLLLKSEDLKTTFLCGLTLGFASLTRANGFVILPFLILWLLLIFPIKKFLMRSLFLFLGTILVIVPWTVRNYLVMHRFVFIQSNGGVTLYAGNNPYANGGYPSGNWLEKLGLTGKVYNRPPIFKGMNEADSDRKFYRMAIEWIRENPIDFLKLLPLKFKYTWSPFTTSQLPIAKNYRNLYALFFMGILSLALLGFFISLKTWKRDFLLFSPILGFTISALIFCGSTRLRFPADPFLIAFSAKGFYFILEKLFKRRSQPL
jgi:4-amino-4-deoxy-L-arabinose transferase-like glycosyltransferase